MTAAPREHPPTSQRTSPAPAFGPRELEAARRLIELAIAEDAPGPDVTTEGLLGGGGAGRGAILEAGYVPRSPGVQCGLPVVRELYRREAPEVEILGEALDGGLLVPGEAILRVRGPAPSILRLERVSLNFLQRLSGIATLTRRWVDELSGTPARLLDTRKTAPGWRLLEKYAVRAGGGTNHRESLSDAILVKDNHLHAVRSLGGEPLAVRIAALRRAHRGLFLELEVATRDEFLDALRMDLDGILLDNFALEDLRWAVETRRRSGASVLLEASGGVRLETLRAIAETGVDRISAGALTHSAPALDIALDVLGVTEERTMEG